MSGVLNEGIKEGQSISLRIGHPVSSPQTHPPLWCDPQVELVLDRESKEAAEEATTWVSLRMRELGVHLSVDGPLCNVLKMKPPMCFSREDGRVLVAAMDQALTEYEQKTQGQSQTSTSEAKIGEAKIGA
jgi:hypothetical protein